MNDGEQVLSFPRFVWVRLDGFDFILTWVKVEMIQLFTRLSSKLTHCEEEYSLLLLWGANLLGGVFMLKSVWKKSKRKTRNKERRKEMKAKRKRRRRNRKGEKKGQEKMMTMIVSYLRKAREDEQNRKFHDKKRHFLEITIVFSRYLLT